MPKSIFTLALLFASMVSKLGLAAEPQWIVPRFAEQSITTDGYHIIEGTSVAPTWAWRTSLSSGFAFDLGMADESSQISGRADFALGFPGRFELGLAMPWARTYGKLDYTQTGATYIKGMAKDGSGLGDLSAALLWSAFDSDTGGFGLLLGLKAGFPTGFHDRLMGEDGFSAEPFVSLSLQALGSRLSLNLAYRIRPQHLTRVDGKQFEQDDEFIWRAGLRIPRKNDVAWSILSEGSIATALGKAPSSDHRPVWLGAGVDLPLGQAFRLGFFAGGRLVGEAAPAFSAGINLRLLPVERDKDQDGVSGFKDQCPLLLEDQDNFEDDDGCPDLDNDSDGFPDDEDLCPMEPAKDDFSEGC